MIFPRCHDNLMIRVNHITHVFFQTVQLHLLTSVAHHLLKMPKDLALVMWVVDESFGVLPPSASKTSEPDLFVESKMTGKQCYEVQNLKISGKFWLCAILRAVSFNIQLKSLCTTLVGTHIVRLKFLKL